jgi:hypothetical protein
MPTLVDKAWIIRFLRAEEIYPRSIWKDLGLWKGIRVTLSLVFHPYKNARIAAAATIESIIERLHRELDSFGG